MGGLVDMHILSCEGQIFELVCRVGVRRKGMVSTDFQSEAARYLPLLTCQGSLLSSSWGTGSALWGVSAEIRYLCGFFTETC